MALLYVVSTMIFVILMAFCRGRRVASGRVLVQFLWGVVALVAVLILLGHGALGLVLVVKLHY